MDDALDVELNDDELQREIRMVTELMVVASLTEGELEQAVIDDALGLEPVRRLPTQRSGS